MNPKNIIVLLIGLVIASGTGYMMYKFLNAKEREIENKVQNEKQKVPPQIPTVKVLVAKSDLAVGMQIGHENLHWQLWPQESVAPAYVVEGNKLTDAGKSEAKRLTKEDFVGATVRQPIAAGQPVTIGLVAKKGERGFMAAVLKPGMRAMSLPVSALTGVSGFILPGDRVDIMWDVKTTGLKGHAFTQTLMEDIRVLAIDTKTAASVATKAGSFTLELTPKQVEMLSIAANNGSLEFVLRSVAPDLADQKRRENAENGLLQVSMGEGTRPGALIGEDILAVSREGERKEVTRDRYTLVGELLYGKAPRKKTESSPPPKPVAVSTPSRTQTGTSSSGRRVKITVVRGSKPQTIRIK